MNFQRTPEPVDEVEDEEFGDFTSARAAVPTNGQSISTLSSTKIVSLNKPVDLAFSKPSGDVDLLGLDLMGDSSNTTKATNFGSFDSFPPKNQTESNIIFIERPKSQQQTQIPSQNFNFVQLASSIPSTAPELLDIFSSPVQPQATQNRN